MRAELLRASWLNSISLSFTVPTMFQPIVPMALWLAANAAVTPAPTPAVTIAKALTRSEESIKDRAKLDGIGIAKLR